MSMAQMAINPNGGAAPAIAVSLSNHTFNSEADFGPVTAIMTFGNTGILSGTFFTEGAPPVNQWLSSVSGPAAGLYSIQVTFISGSTPTTGATGAAYLNLGTARTWTNERSTFGFRSSILGVKIRRDSDSVEMASVTMDLTAWVSP